ncbi:MAG: DEAD/DEAH box helicase [Chloroflexota bacterium]
MDASVFIHDLVTSPDYRQQLVHVEHIHRRDPSFGSLERPLDPVLREKLEGVGIDGLYRHQAQALDGTLSGRSVIVATASASGKSLCYHLATLQMLRGDPLGRSLYLYPTKALAQDQLRGLRSLACPELLSENEIATFDGDTPQVERSDIKRRAKVVLSNPDMLHLGILPNHRTWSRLFRHLKYVVLDEAHVYRGIFGSHMGNLMRRLRRVCSLYGSEPQFICSSATIANPQAHAENLCGLPFEAVTENGSPHGEKYFGLWNPPVIDEARGTRKSANSEATVLFRRLVESGIRSLVFARTRNLTELIYVYTRDQLAPELAERISPYRAGYLPEDRRRIERDFFAGDLLGLVATTALELGIDIGDLDATVLTGYPGSIASAWQQAGRSGRSESSSLSLLIARDDPLDQYLMRNPEFFFGRNFEDALIDPGNPYVLGPHLLCAAWESPLEEGDEAYFGGGWEELVAQLEAGGKLRKRGSRWYPSPSVKYPAQDVSIRSAAGHYAILDECNGQLLETVDANVAFFQVYPGAVYLHQGVSYLIRDLDVAGRTAIAEQASVDYYTQTKELTDIRVGKMWKEKRCGDVSVRFGDAEVTTQVVGYRKKRQFSEEVISEEPLDLPPQTFATKAVWFGVPQGAVARIYEADLDLAGGLHACEHAAIGLLPLFALCDRNDLGGVSTPLHPDTGQAAIFIYDAYPGGIGIAEKGYGMVQELWRATLKLVKECPCQDGCPSCIQSPKCGNNNQPLDKQAAVVLLQALAEESVGR